MQILFIFMTDWKVEVLGESAGIVHIPPQGVCNRIHNSFCLDAVLPQ